MHDTWDTYPDNNPPPNSITNPPSPPPGVFVPELQKHRGEPDTRQTDTHEPRELGTTLSITCHDQLEL
jgi:hypothetical protein